MNEFDQALKEFIEETVKKAVDERTAKIIEETVKKAVGEYCVITNNQLALLQTALNTLMGVLIVHRFPSTEELRAILTKAMEEKAKEFNEINLGGNSSKQENTEVEKPES